MEQRPFLIMTVIKRGNGGEMEFNYFNELYIVRREKSKGKGM